MSKKLTVIICVTESNLEVVKLLEMRINLFHLYYKNFVDYLVVDYALNDNISKEIAVFCTKHSWIYVKYDDVEYNKVKAINFGIKASKTEFIIIEHLDVIKKSMVYYSEIYKHILEEIIECWNKKTFNFYIIPTVQLDNLSFKKKNI